jgi:rhamnosyltransferase
MFKVAGVVILYFPDKELNSRIASYLNYLSRLYIFDNSDNTEKTFDNIFGDKVVYIKDGKNEGISIRLNQAASMAINESYSWLLTMDQDSYFPLNAFKNYLICIEKYEDKSNTAMFGVQFLNEGIDPSKCSFEILTHLITSGSILNLNAYTKIGEFDEALFIDKVDHEYCFRAILNNFKIVRANNIFLHHNLGTTNFGRSLKNFKKSPRVLHSPIRIYYITRNYFYLKSRYKDQFKESFTEMKKELFIRLKNNILYNSNKLKTISYFFKGIRDSRSGKMGKLNS